jgi:hypothetical protein
MNIHDKDPLKFNGNEVWDKGNFVPSVVAVSGSYSDLSDKPTVSDLGKKSLTVSTTVAGYYAFAQTPINPAEYSAMFKITVTSTANVNIGHVLYVKVEGHANTMPIFQVDSKTNNSTAGTTGLYYLRGVYPKVVNNGYASFIEFYVYDATKRDVQIELIESKNVSMLSSVVISSYNSTYQAITTPAVLYNGFITNGTIYGVLANNAPSAYYVYNDSYVAGEALVANDIVFLQTDNKWYKANITGRSIPFGTIIARCASTYAINVGVGAYPFIRSTLPTGVTGTIGKDIFIRGTIANDVFTTDGNITTALTEGYSYIRIGSVVYNTSTIQYDGNNRVYTISTGGVSAIDGINIDVPTKVSDLTNDSGFITSSSSITGNSATATKFLEVDTRSTNENPQYYMTIGKGITYEFKASSIIGLSAMFLEVPTYSEVSTYISWGDPSGGYPFQLAVNNIGMYYRIGTSTTTWGVWSKVAKTSDIPTNTNQLTNGSDYITSLGAPVQSVSGRNGAVVLTKSDVGLSSVDNTTDTNKPVSTPQLNALALKANLASPTFTGTPKSTTPATADNSTNIATTAFIKAQGYVTSAQAGTIITVSSTAPLTPKAGDIFIQTF